MLLRHILLVLLSLSLPMTGLASVIAPASCAMQTAQADAERTSHKTQAGMHGIDSCCKDQHSNQQKSSDPCNNGSACSGISLLWFSALSQSPLLYVPRSTTLPTQPPTQFATNALAAVWRPPQN